MMGEGFVTASDPRALRYAEWGDPDGFPVLGLHGTPGGRFDRHPDVVAIAALVPWLAERLPAC